MFPADFAYAAPESLDEALSLLADHAEDAKVLAGGQSLIPLMKPRFTVPAFVMDLGLVPSLDTLAEDQGNGGCGSGHLCATRRTSAPRCWPPAIPRWPRRHR